MSVAAVVLRDQQHYDGQLHQRQCAEGVRPMDGGNGLGTASCSERRRDAATAAQLPYAIRVERLNGWHVWCAPMARARHAA